MITVTTHSGSVYRFRDDYAKVLSGISWVDCTVLHPAEVGMSLLIHYKAEDKVRRTSPVTHVQTHNLISE